MDPIVIQRKVLDQIVIRPGHSPNVSVTRSPATVTIVHTNVPIVPGQPYGGAPYYFSQLSASSVWTVNHNLGWKPQVTILSSGGIEVDAEIVHLSDNQFQVYFNQPYAGKGIAR